MLMHIISTYGEREIKMETKPELTKEEKLAVLNSDLQEFFELKQKESEVQKRLKVLNGSISSLISELYPDTNCYTNDKFNAYITECSRSTLNAALVEKIFKITLTNECYKVSNYNTLKVQELPKTLMEEKKIKSDVSKALDDITL